MSLDLYLLIFSFALYILIARGFEKFNLGVTFSGATVVLLPFLLGLLFKWVMSPERDRTLASILSPMDVILVLSQLAIAFWVFHSLRKYEASIATWLVVSGLGSVTLFLVLPFIATNLF